MKQLIVILFISLLFSCSKQDISLETENQIFQSVIIPVMDSIHLSVLPPPYNDSIKQIYEREKMLIIIKDSTEILSADEQINFLKYYKNSTMAIDSSYETKVNANVIKLKNLKSHLLSFKLSDKNYNFKFSSEIKNQKLNTIETYFCGTLGLSNIMLDNSKKRGLFSISYHCCNEVNCGNGWTVYVVNINGIWKVDKLIPTWIS